MCELLGMSANTPTDICFSFSGLMERGGRTGPHRDGWGIVFYEGRGARAFHDPNPSAQSPLANWVKDYPIKSQIVISHIRQANVGATSLENTHPFQRELWGRSFSFAHNGQVPDVKKKPLQFYLPIGDTDSEHAFCWILDQLRKRFPTRPDSPQQWLPLVASVSRQLAELGVFNMLLSDGEVLLSFCSTKLCWLTRQAPFNHASLKDTELTVNFAKETTDQDKVTIIATEPLTADESWQAYSSGEFRAFLHGTSIFESSADEPQR
ncbi:MAG: class II glutamine amidotransferase [Bermanella sp.]